MEVFLGYGQSLMEAHFIIKHIINHFMEIYHCIGLSLIRVGMLHMKIIF